MPVRLMFQVQHHKFTKKPFKFVLVIPFRSQENFFFSSTNNVTGVTWGEGPGNIAFFICLRPKLHTFMSKIVKRLQTHEIFFTVYEMFFLNFELQ